MDGHSNATMEATINGPLCIDCVTNHTHSCFFIAFYCFVCCNYFLHFITRHCSSWFLAMPDYVLADMASKDGDRKKSFDFRMSKKVAELTQVVHMLFTRNHEKEVELEALRDAYEYEIELVIKDAKGQIYDLEKQIKTLENSREGAQAKSNAEKELAKREEEWQKRFAFMEKQLGDEKRECQNARDLLIQAQKDIEKLRQCQVEEISRKNRELENKGKEVERLKTSITCLEKRLKDADNNSNTNLLELRRENEKLQKEVTSLHGNLAENERLRDQVAARNKQLESEIRSLKKELVKRSDRSGRSSAASRVEFREPPATVSSLSVCIFFWWIGVVG